MEQVPNGMDDMDPREAMKDLGTRLKRLFSILDDEDRTRFVLDLFGGSGADKVSGRDKGRLGMG